MDWYEFIAQAVGICGMVMNILSYQQRSQKGILLMQFVGGCFFAVNFYMLGAMTGFLMNVIGIIRSFVYYNKDLFDELSLPDPYELYKNGEWTYEKLREIAQKATVAAPKAVTNHVPRVAISANMTELSIIHLFHFHYIIKHKKKETDTSFLIFLIISFSFIFS